MTTLFLIVCTVSVIFFVMFLLKCFFTAPTLQTTKREAVAPAHKLIGARAVDSECGRRLFVHLEEEMADFLTAHGRTAAMLLAVIILLPLGLRAQTPGTTAAPQDSTSAGDQQIPPAVAKQLAAMQQRIDQLEQELKSRASQSPTADGVASAPAHALDDEQASAGGLSVTQENARAQQKKSDKPEPFSFADFTWLNGNSRIKEVPFDTKFFTPEIRADVDYVYDFNHPQDDTISGSSEIFRANEFQVTQLGVGGDFHWDNVQARVMTQFGMYSQTTPRNDASPARGQWQACRCLPLHFRSVRRIPHQRAGWNQHSGRHFHVLHRPVQLLQLRQLGLSAVVRVVEHAMVLQWHAGADLSQRAPEDRALADQWMAVVRPLQ